MAMAPDGSRGVAAHYRVLFRTCPWRTRLPLRGLDPDARYAVTAWTSFDEPAASFERGGDELMSIGLAIEPAEPFADDGSDGRVVRGDFAFRLFDLRRL
ncbi:MAG: GH36 C-terminal domain-containing protein [Chloroflexota bacterium]